MKIDRIEYQKNYNIMGMQWEKIIAGATLEEGDDFKDSVNQLRHQCDNAAQSMINTMYPSSLSQEDRGVVNHHLSNFTPIPTPEPEEKISPEEGRKNTIESINKCTTIKELIELTNNK